MSLQNRTVLVIGRGSGIAADDELSANEDLGESPADAGDEVQEPGQSGPRPDRRAHTFAGANGRSFAPMIASQNITATSAKFRGWQ